MLVVLIHDAVSDPILASFAGGAVGVISALVVVEISNAKQQEHRRCKYCVGTGIMYPLQYHSIRYDRIVLVKPTKRIDRLMMFCSM